MTEPMPHEQDAFEFKSAARIDLVSFQPKTAELDAIAAQLQKKLGNGEHFFSHEALLIDLSQVQEQELDLAALIRIMQQSDLLPIAIRHGNEAQQKIAREHQLGVLTEEKNRTAARPAVAEYEPALVVTRPVRTGQQIYAKNRDLVVLDLVSAGAELIADGSIHVYAPLRGRALAGARGNTAARIFTVCLEAELLSVAGIYRAMDEKLPESLREKPAQVFLDKKKLVIEALRF